jgi:hypothetical protein
MTKNRTWKRRGAAVLVGCMVACHSIISFAEREQVEASLNDRGQTLATEYTKALETLGTEIAAKLPA